MPLRTDIFEPYKFDGELPNLGNGIDHRPLGLLQDRAAAAKKDYDGLTSYLDGIKGKIDGFKQHPLYRIPIERNIDPELNKIMGGLLGPMVEKQIRDGNMNFHAEMPGFNSDRYYLGMRWNF